MATLLSEQFLRVHPATKLWWEQREQCERCAHCVLYEGDEGEGIMRCKAVRVPRTVTRPILGAYCIDARAQDGLCGPEARLYKPAAV